MLWRRNIFPYNSAVIACNFFLFSMFTFFKEALQELEHVVWPTQKETRKYMNYNIGIIVTMAIFLMVLWFVFRSTLQVSREEVQKVFPSTATWQDATATQAYLDSLLQQIGASGATQSGASSTEWTESTIRDASGEVLWTASPATLQIQGSESGIQSTTPSVQ